MNATQTIEIELDIHKRIEAGRRSFEESPSDILRRLLNGVPASPPPESPTAPSAEGRPWSSKGVELPHGTRLRMTYNGVQHTAVIEDGAWLVPNDPNAYNAPSPAAYAVARTRAGDPARIDGWEYWEALRPGDQQWRWLKSLRLAAGA